MAPLTRAPRAAGLVLSPDDGVGLAVRAVVRFHLRTFVREETGARAGALEPVHQLRVATRRLRATLHLFRPVLPATLVRGVRDDLAWLAAAIGAVRDLDVLAELAATCGRRLDGDSRHALAPLGPAIRDRHVAAQAALVVALDSLRCRRLLGRLTAFADSAVPAGQPKLGEVVPALVLPMLRAVLRSGRRVRADAPAAAQHRLRVRVKRLRYALETLEGLGGSGMRKARRRLVRIQDLLGCHQDAVTGVAWLRQYALTAGLPPATLLAVGGLMHAFDRRARKTGRAFPERWARLERPLRGMVATEFASGRRRGPRAMPAAAS